MKDKVITLLLAFVLCGCVSISDQFTEKHDGLSDRFKNIEEERFLFYDKRTKIVYYFMNGFSSSSGCYSMPYISENGNYCKYLNGKIVEVLDE